MTKDLMLLGIEPMALNNEELGEEDAKCLGHTIGLDSFLTAMKAQGDTIYGTMKLLSMIIETSLRNVYGCPLIVSYWSPPKSKVGYIKMTNPNLQLVSDIELNFSENRFVLHRLIGQNCFGEMVQTEIGKIKTLIHEALQWAAIPPNPQTPLFFNKTERVCVFIDYNEAKVFEFNAIKTLPDHSSMPSWVRHISDMWKGAHVTAVYSDYKGGNHLFNKLNATVPKVAKIIVLDQG